MPDLGQIRIFLAVAEELNFTRAAERLHLAQQAVSKSVGQLETQLGVKLLERTTHRVELTPAGAVLLESGRDVVGRADAAFEEARRVGGALTGGVAVGLTPAVGTVVRSEIVNALRTAAPDLSIAFRELRPAEAEQVLSRRELDAVVSRTPPASEALDAAELAPSPAKLVVAAAHRLAGRDAVAVTELDGDRLQAWNPPGHRYTDELVARLAEHGARVDVVLAQVIGGGGPPTLHDDEFALLPAGWPLAEGTVQLGLEPAVLLPLWVLWPRGSVPVVVARIREHLAYETAASRSVDRAVASSASSSAERSS